MPLLTATNLRLSLHEVDVLEDTSFVLEGPHALVLGAPIGLYAAVAEPGRPGRDLLLRGAPVNGGRIRTFPPAWTATEWVTWRVRLAGVAARLAARRAGEMLEAFQLGPQAHLPLAKTSQLLQQALPLVAAVAVQLPEPTVLVFDDVFAGLDDESALYLAQLFVKHAGTQPWIGFLPLVSSSSALVEAASEALVFDAGRIVAQGPPRTLANDDRTYVVRVVGEAAGWPQKLAELGIEVVAEREYARPEGQGRELTVAFSGELGPLDLFALAAESTDVIVELFPTTGKLA